MVLAVQVKQRDRSAVVNKILSLNLPDRVTVIVMTTRDNCFKFYVNQLRNIAITSIRTSHFLILDMDLWPVGMNSSCE